MDKAKTGNEQVRPIVDGGTVSEIPLAETNVIARAAVEAVGNPISSNDIDTRIIATVAITLLEKEQSVMGSQIANADSSTNPEVLVPAPAPAPSPSAPVSRSDAGPREVILFFDQSSWADVRDARDRQLLRDSVRAGTTIRLQGEPPFTVFIGNAQGVRYRYRGKERSVLPSDEGLFGRFKVGELE
jgi:cytoskeletal protein RodZ